MDRPQISYYYVTRYQKGSPGRDGISDYPNPFRHVPYQRYYKQDRTDILMSLHAERWHLSRPLHELPISSNTRACQNTSQIKTNLFFVLMISQKY